MKTIHGSGCKTAGFTLIEVMIALAVLTIGLTGLAAMQISAMQYSHSSHYRSMASTIALDFEERMWLELADSDFDCAPEDEWDNEVSVLATHWNQLYNDDGDGDVDVEEQEAEAVTAQRIRIPGLNIAAGAAATAGSTVTIPITLSWTEARFGDTESTTESFSFNVRIQCTTA
jgi:type IV pilus modification protein PilV